MTTGHIKVVIIIMLAVNPDFVHNDYLLIMLTAILTHVSIETPEPYFLGIVTYIPHDNKTL